VQICRYSTANDQIRKQAMSKFQSFRLSALAGTLCTAILLGCTPVTPPGATTSASYDEHATALVTAIDKTHRRLTLQSSDGQSATVVAPPEVQNFPQIQVGDTIRLTYRAQLDIRVAGNVAPIPGVIVETGGLRAQPGAKPAGLWTTRTRRSVQIVSVDRTSHTFTYREPDGSLDSIVVENPANFPLADGLTPGTIVDVTETEAVALSVAKI
jgi:hypothetical protein